MISKVRPMLSPTNIEDKLIILICKTFLRTAENEELITFVDQQSIDWKVAANKIAQHKIELISFFTFKRLRLGRKKPGIFKHLKNRVQIRTQRSKELYQEQGRVLEVFENLNIPVYPYKGVILSHTYYPSPLLRDSIDIDLAISEDDLEKSMEIMPTLGYSLFNENRETTDVKKMRSYDIDFSWMNYDENGKMKINVEFHWQPSHSVLWVPLTFRDIITETQDYTIHNAQVKSFKSSLHTIIILTHHGLVDGWGKTRHLIDFAQILKKTDDTELQEIVALAKKYRMYNTLLVGLVIMNKMLDVEIPDLDYPKRIHKLAEEMIPKIINNEISAKWSEQKVKVKYYLKMRDSFGDRVRSLVMLLKFLYIEKRTKYLA